MHIPDSRANTAVLTFADHEYYGLSLTLEKLCSVHEHCHKSYTLSTWQSGVILRSNVVTPGNFCSNRSQQLLDIAEMVQSR